MSANLTIRWPRKPPWAGTIIWPTVSLNRATITIGGRSAVSGRAQLCCRLLRIPAPVVAVAAFAGCFQFLMQYMPRDTLTKSSVVCPLPTTCFPRNVK